MNRFVGYVQQHKITDDILNNISQQITKGIKTGTGRNVIVPNDTIQSVFDQVFFAQTQGDDIVETVYKTIDIIVSQIVDEHDTIECRKRQSIWNTMYGDFNQEGLRAHSFIKLNNKQRKGMNFMLNY